jgi:acyl-ACP thioesterase
MVIFFGPAVMINVGRAEYSQQDYKEGLQTMILENGDIVWIDTKLVHRSIQLSKLRYNITFRRVKPEYAITPLF